MNKTSSFCLGLILAACAACTSMERTAVPLSSPVTAAETQQLTGAPQNLGEKVVAELNRRYADAAVNCGTNSKPAFLCNGILMRGTKTGNYHVWNNTPLSHVKGGVSFSYLRRDVIFSKLAYSYTNGYIFKPILRGDRVPGIIDPDILCSFPVDGWTDGRASTGCGAYPGVKNSDLCRIEGITTATQWNAAYSAVSLDQLGGKECAFDVDDSQNHLAGPAFTASLEARVALGTPGYNIHNEILLGVWPEDIGEKLPLEAFFYIEGSAAGLAESQQNQKDLQATNNIVIPIIKIKLPTSDTRPVWTVNAPATFEYSADDQAVAIPVK